MKLFVRQRFGAYLLLIFSLACTQIFRLYGDFWDDVVQDITSFGVDTGLGTACAFKGLWGGLDWGEEPSCQALMPPQASPGGCAALEGSSSYCTDNAFVNLFLEASKGGGDEDKCKADVATFTESSNACKGPLSALAGEMQAAMDEVNHWLQPVIDVECLTVQLNNAGEENMILPGCDPTTDSCKSGSSRFNATNLYAQYMTGYLFNHPHVPAYPSPISSTPETLFTISDYINQWIFLQTAAYNRTDMAGHQLAPQISVLDPDAFLGSAATITSRINADLQTALQTNINFLTTNSNNFFPNAVDVPPANCSANGYPPCCNAPTKSLPDAQANIMTNLNQKMTAILALERGDMLEFFLTNTTYPPIDATKIPPLPIIDLAGTLMMDTNSSDYVNNQPVPALVGKIVTNWPGLKAIMSSQKEYLGQLFLTQMWGTRATVSGSTVACDPGSIQQQYTAALKTCNLAATEMQSFDTLATMGIQIILFMTIFKVAEVGSEALSFVKNDLLSGIGKITSSLVSFYGKAMMVPMLLGFLFPETQAWFKDLPPAVQEAWSPQIPISIGFNVSTVQTELLCNLQQYLSAFQPQSCGQVGDLPCSTGYSCNNNNICYPTC